MWIVTHVDSNAVVLPQPPQFISYSSPDDNKVVEYELDAADEAWLDALDEEGDAPVGLTAEFVEVAVDRLEKALAAGRVYASPDDLPLGKRGRY